MSYSSRLEGENRNERRNTLISTKRFDAHDCATTLRKLLDDIPTKEGRTFRPRVREEHICSFASPLYRKSVRTVCFGIIKATKFHKYSVLVTLVATTLEWGPKKSTYFCRARHGCVGRLSITSRLEGLRDLAQKKGS